MAKVNILDSIFDKIQNVDEIYMKTLMKVDKSEVVMNAVERFVKSDDDECVLTNTNNAYTEAAFKQGFRCGVQLFLELHSLGGESVEKQLAVVEDECQQGRAYLKKLRKKNHLTQADVSRRIGVAPSTYTMIEIGERQKDLNLSMVKKLSEVFGVSVDFIIEQEGKVKG